MLAVERRELEAREPGEDVDAAHGLESSAAFVARLKMLHERRRPLAVGVVEEVATGDARLRLDEGSVRGGVTLEWKCAAVVVWLQVEYRARGRIKQLRRERVQLGVPVVPEVESATVRGGGARARARPRRDGLRLFDARVERRRVELEWSRCRHLRPLPRSESREVGLRIVLRPRASTDRRRQKAFELGVVHLAELGGRALGASSFFVRLVFRGALGPS